MRKNIVTIGSCLSIKVADSLCDNFGFKRVSSSQHYRVDVYVDTFLKGKFNQFLQSDCEFEYKEEFKYANILENQMFDVGFGKSLPSSSTHQLINHKVAIESGKIDVLIIDNFADIYFKVYENKERNFKLFLNKEYFKKFDNDFIIENEFVKPENYQTSLRDFINYFRCYNPISEVIVINFPVNLNSNEKVRERAMQLFNVMKSISDIKIIDPIGIYKNDLSRIDDIHHFSNRKYSQYASLVYGEILR
ncbi:hypothetical protein ACOCGX_002499 [Vibrio cholerae]|uniref:hypothetical protein n=1 Tax=Vibrio cholerae TaxID=666 RepID=UPI00301A294A